MDCDNEDVHWFSVYVEIFGEKNDQEIKKK